MKPPAPPPLPAPPGATHPAVPRPPALPPVRPPVPALPARPHPPAFKPPAGHLPAGLKLPDVKLPAGLKLPEVKLPAGLKLPEVKLPDIKLPGGLKLPDVKLPGGLKLPDVKLPGGLKLPDIKLPGGLKLPDVKLPADLKLPGVKLPDVKLPGGLKPPALKLPAVKPPGIVKPPAAKPPAVKPMAMKAPAKPPAPARPRPKSTPERSEPKRGQGSGGAASRHTPKYRIQIRGADAPPALAEDVREVVVDQSTEMADHFVITLANDGSRWSDSGTFKIGTPIQIGLGYEETGTTVVMDGEVTALHASYPRRGPSTLRVQGFTKYHRLQRTKHTRSWPERSKLSDVAKKIAQEVGLGDGVEDSGLQYETVYQHNRTNLQFLLELARRIDFEVFAAEGKLYFRRARLDRGKVETFKWQENLISFRPRAALARMPTEVKVLSWDPVRKQAVPGGAAPGAEGPAMDGTATGPRLSQALGPARQQVVFEAIRKDQEARALAEAVLKRATRRTVRAEAVCQGAAAIQPGMVVEMDGVGPEFGGPYYVERAVHGLLPAGFSTTLHLARTSTGRTPEPAPKPPKPPPPPPPGEPGHRIKAKIVDAEGRPSSMTPYDVVDSAGRVIETGETDWHGTISHPVPQSGQYTVRARQQLVNEEAEGEPELVNPRWGKQGYLHGEEVEMLIDGPPALEGRTVRFQLQRHQDRQWTTIGETTAPLVSGTATGRLTVEHPAEPQRQDLHFAEGADVGPRTLRFLATLA